MKFWPLWLDRLYWRWYVKRHPVHTAVCPLHVLHANAGRSAHALWRSFQATMFAEIQELLEFTPEEERWAKQWLEVSS